jgi:hypothetical protein
MIYLKKLKQNFKLSRALKNQSNISNFSYTQSYKVFILKRLQKNNKCRTHLKQGFCNYFAIA